MNMKATFSTVLLSVAVFSSCAWAHGETDHAQHAAAAYGEPGKPGVPTRDIVVVMKEADGRMLFLPDVVSVKRGEQIRFQLKNEGVLDHEFMLGTAAELDEHADMMKAMPDMKHADPNSKSVAPKAIGDLVWRFTNAGEFDFACLIPGHREAGMKGKILVK